MIKEVVSGTAGAVGTGRQPVHLGLADDVDRRVDHRALVDRQ